MKSRFFLSLILVVTLILSCSKDDEPKEELSPAYEFSNIILTPLNDRDVNDGITDIPIVVSATGSIIDISKVTLEFYLEHTWQQDIELSLITPDGAEQIFVYRVGGSSDYIGSNLLRFNSTFIDELPNTDINIPAGNYKESKGSNIIDPNGLINLEPIFSFLEGKNINGIWKLRVKDNAVFDTGNSISCKLMFDGGALEL